MTAWTITHAVAVAERTAWRGSPWGDRALRHAQVFIEFVGADTRLDQIKMSTLAGRVRILG